MATTVNKDVLKDALKKASVISCPPMMLMDECPNDLLNDDNGCVACWCRVLGVEEYLKEDGWDELG